MPRLRLRLRLRRTARLWSYKEVPKSDEQLHPFLALEATQQLAHLRVKSRLRGTH